MRLDGSGMANGGFYGAFDSGEASRFPISNDNRGSCNFAAQRLRRSIYLSMKLIAPFTLIIYLFIKKLASGYKLVSLLMYVRVECRTIYLAQLPTI
jgi:hypothetical protein